MNNEHITNEQMHLLLDGALPQSETVPVRGHLKVCTQCNETFVSLSRLDDALVNLPVEHLASDFTSTVPARLHIGSKTPLLFRIAENLAYLFGLMIVSGVMLAAFVLSGVISSEQISQTHAIVRETTGNIAGATNSIVDTMTGGFQTYLPFLVGHESVKIAVMGTIVLGLLALLDKFLKRRMM